MAIRITGLNSGLDTESIISALVSAYSYKTQKYTKAQTKLSWTQDLWKSLNTKIYSLYSSLDNLRYSSCYNLKTTSVSDTTKATVTASSSAVNGTQTLNVIQTAQAGYLTGGQLDSGVTSSTTLAELGYTGGDGELVLTQGDGTTTSITVSQGTTISSLISSLKDAGVNASYDETNRRIYISSTATGADNDFTLTAGNLDGASALSKLGLNVESEGTAATYATYTQYYDEDGDAISQNVINAISAYNAAKSDYETRSAQNSNMSAAYSYATAYSAMMDALKSSGLSEDDQSKLQTLLSMTSTERANSLMDADGNVYTQTSTDEDGNAIYSYTDENGDEQLIQRVITYTDASGNTYTASDSGFVDEDGNVYTSTGETDEDGNTIYSYTQEDGTEVTASITSSTSYYAVTASEEETGYYSYTDDDGITYTPNDDGTYGGSDGNLYKLSNDGSTMTQVEWVTDEAGEQTLAEVEDGRTATTASSEAITKTVYTQTSSLSDVTTASEALTALEEDENFTLSEDDISTLTSNISTVNSYVSTEDTVLDDTDTYSIASIVAAVEAAYADGDVTTYTSTLAEAITENKTVMAEDEETMDTHSKLAEIAEMENGDEKDAAIASFVEQVQAAQAIVDAADYSTDAVKIDGQDAIIKLNGVTYTGSTNAFTINGLTITAQAETGDGDENAVTITTQTDTQGIYDKIKDFLTQYNELINEITSLYNADSARGYEPLTDDEKDAMSDTEIEKWEEKIKDALLSGDSTLYGVMSSLTSTMSSGIEINGKTYYLSSFGISTLGYLNAAENEQYAYHIDGDSDDSSTASNTDKLLSMITSDPDTVISYFQELTNNLHDALYSKMKSTTLSSAFTVYNDKEMASEYSDYTETINKWQEKLEAKEDYYYSKFSAMETALSKLNSQSSSLSSLLGG